MFRVVAHSLMPQRFVVVYKQPQHVISRCNHFSIVTPRCGLFFPLNERFRSLNVTYAQINETAGHEDPLNTCTASITSLTL